jgi:hypothetical protein
VERDQNVARKLGVGYLLLTIHRSFTNALFRHRHMYVVLMEAIEI